MGKSKDLATGVRSGDFTVDTDTLHVDATNNKVGVGTTAPTNNLTIIDGGATPYGSDATILLDMKRNTANTDAANAVALRLANNSNGFNIKYGGASDTLNISGGSGNTVATFRNDGGMTLPYQPSFAARGLSSGSTQQDLVFSAIRYNVGSHYSSSTGRFTCPVAGTYLFGWTNIGGNANDVYRYYIRVNGSANISGTGNDTHLRIDTGATGSEYGTNAMFTWPVQLSVNDYVNIYYYADAGTSTYTASDYPQFWGYLVG